MLFKDLIKEPIVKVDDRLHLLTGAAKGSKRNVPDLLLEFAFPDYKQAGTWGLASSGFQDGSLFLCPYGSDKGEITIDAYGMMFSDKQDLEIPFMKIAQFFQTLEIQFQE